MTPTGIGPIRSTSVPGSMTQRPSGFSSSLAILARNFDEATPTDAVSPPVSLVHVVLQPLHPGSQGVRCQVDRVRVAARRSTNASSSDSGSTSGDSARSRPITWPLASR